MRIYILSLALLFSPYFTKAQQTSDNLWGSQKFRFGISVQVAPSYWKQNNLNNILLENHLPDTRATTTGASFGDIMQWNKLRITMLFVTLQNSKSTSNETLEQQFGGGEINAEYYIIRKKAFALSPSIGVGYLGGTTRIRKQSTSESFSDAIINRSTAELFNRQGYINAALNFSFSYAPRLEDHLFQAALGYRFGFANTKWSTDPKFEVLTEAPTDAMRQVYLALKMNFLFTNKSR